MLAKQSYNQRHTLQHLIQFVLHGNVIEIAKVLRRRTIHGGRLLLEAYYHLFGFYYYNPRIQKQRGRRALRRLLVKTIGFDLSDETPKPHRIALIMRDGEIYPKSSAFIRLILPLTDPSLRDQVSLRFYSENTTAVADDTTACIIQRTAYDRLDDARKLVAQARRIGSQIIIDTDDAFHSIDHKHPEYTAHRQRLRAFNYLVEAADQLWLSTPALAHSFAYAKRKSAVVINNLDARLWRLNSPRPASTAKLLRLLYMGTVSHDADFALVFPVLDSLASELPGSFEVTVIGVTSDLPERPWLKRKYQKRGGSIYLRFVPWLLKQSPFDIGLSPLVDNAFNASKSDIKCLDYLALGLVPIVSKSPAYANRDLDPFIVRVTNSGQGWHDTLRGLVQDPAGFRARYQPILGQARTYLLDRRSSLVTAQKLGKLLGFSEQ